MRAPILIGSVALAALAGCGLENMLANTGRTGHDRPASAIRGAAFDGVEPRHLSVVDGSGSTLAPFLVEAGSQGGAGRYELRLPSGNYSMIRAQARAGNFLLRALVPSLGEESIAAGVDFDAGGVTETLVLEAWLSANRAHYDWRLLSPAAYLGDGATSGTRTLLRRDMATAGTPAHALRAMVDRVMKAGSVTSGLPDPVFFAEPVLDAGYAVTSSPIDAAWLGRTPVDIDGDGQRDLDTAAFDAQLSLVAPLADYSPAGCADPARVRVVFTVDFNEGAKDGNCTVVNRFKWAVNKPGKTMYFVAWIHEDSPIQDPKLNALIGAGVPNVLAMHDDGTGGDEVAGDNVYAISFDLPRGLRIGYKYTWGFRGAPWTGSEEWPGNSRLLEVVDVNLDNFVHRSDVFGDEATNKDQMNLSRYGGSVTWDTDLRGCGPEAREQKVAPVIAHSACGCDAWLTPTAIGPLTLACQ